MTTIPGPTKVTIQDIERALAARSFIDFLDFVKLLEPPTATNRGGVIPFEKWDHIIRFVDILENERLINVLKSRQLGF